MKKVFALAFLMTVVAAIPTLAATTFSQYWKQDAAGNWYVEQPGKGKVTNAWLCDDAVATNGKDVWYLLDAGGNMLTAGLVQDGTGNFYSLETSHNGYYGMLRYKSGTYDGVSLQLESQHNGSFAAIKNADGIEALKTKYGVTNISNINNANCVYTSSFGNSFSGERSLFSTEITEKNYDGIEFSTENLGVSSMALACILNPESSTATARKILEYKKDYDTGTDHRYATANQISEAKAFAEAWAKNNTSPSMSDKEKHELIFDYMRSTITYSEDAVNHQTSYGALIDRSCVCSGFANGYIVMAEACGITAKYLTLNGHAMNLVLLDGKWYATDVTNGYKYNPSTTGIYYMHTTPEGDSTIDAKVDTLNERNAGRSEAAAKTNSRKNKEAEGAIADGAVFSIDDDELVERMVESALSRTNDQKRNVTQTAYCVLYFNPGAGMEEVYRAVTDYPGGSLTSQCLNLMMEEYDLKQPHKITGSKYNNVVIDYEQVVENNITRYRPWTDEDGSTYVLVRFHVDYA